MSPLVLAGLALPVAAAYLLLRPARHAGASPILLVGLALGGGLGIASFAFFLALILFDGRLAGVAGVDAALLVVASLVWRRAGAARASAPVPWSPTERVLAAAVAVAASASLVSFLANTADLPHGRWDAWATWNLRARALAGAGADWRTVFAKPTIHGDYPLLLPATVARLWVYAGAMPVLVPAVVAAGYAVALVLVLYGALDTLRGRTPALVGTLCLLGTPLFLRIAPWQYADVPLAFNVLAMLALLAVAEREPAARPPALLVSAGVAAALTAWTKNEGMVLVLGIAGLHGLAILRRREADVRAAAYFAAGLLPLALLVLYFKVVLAPPSPQLSQHGPSMLARLLDLGRYGAVVRVGGWELLRGTVPVAVGLVLYALLLGRTRDRRARAMAGTIAAIVVFGAVAYGFTYVTSRADPAWYVGHSVDRLELQLWPSALLALLLYVASPAERETASAAAVAATRVAPRPRSQRRRAARR